MVSRPRTYVKTFIVLGDSRPSVSNSSGRDTPACWSRLRHGRILRASHRKVRSRSDTFASVVSTTSQAPRGQIGGHPRSSYHRQTMSAMSAPSEEAPHCNKRLVAVAARPLHSTSYLHSHPGRYVPSSTPLSYNRPNCSELRTPT